MLPIFAELILPKCCANLAGISRNFTEIRQNLQVSMNFMVCRKIPYIYKKQLKNMAFARLPVPELALRFWWP